MDKEEILGVSVTTATKNEILKYITTSLKTDNKKLYITTPNPEMLVFAGHDPEFEAILNKADIALPDGIGLLWAAKLLKKGVKRRITGVDMLYSICEVLSKEGLTAGFLGGEKGVAEKTAECLITLYPSLNIAFVGSEWPLDWFDNNRNSKLKPQISKLQLKTQNLDTKYKINSSSDGDRLKRSGSHGSSEVEFPAIDFLFVAFGFPKQEKWIYENLNKIPVKVAMGVGGAFDYISGKVPRAPKLVRDLGFEWLYRLIVQPWRWRRQLALLEFVYLAIKEKLSMVVSSSHKQ